MLCAPGQSGDRIEFVDMLTDTDGDGVGDVNEATAGTSRTNPRSSPGESTIDILALYNEGFRQALDGYPYTRIQHVMALTSAVFRDSGTNLRMHMIGTSEVALNASGVPDLARVSELLDEHGADLFFRLHMGQTEMGCWIGVGGCASMWARSGAVIGRVSTSTAPSAGGRTARSAPRTNSDTTWDSSTRRARAKRTVRSAGRADTTSATRGARSCRTVARSYGECSPIRAPTATGPRAECRSMNARARTPSGASTWSASRWLPAARGRRTRMATASWTWRTRCRTIPGVGGLRRRRSGRRRGPGR